MALSTVIGTESVPKNVVNAMVTAALWQEWAAGYSGWFGVPISGVQAGSATVWGLPSVAARGMAWTGRQNVYWYLASKQAIMPSPPEAWAMASRRAVSARLRPRSLTRRNSARFHWVTPWSRQKLATAVCSGVGVALSTRPRASPR